jgi:hypothetical protein
MAEYKRNPWVTFLRQYGPVAGNDAMYDEHVLNSARRNGVEALRLDTGGTLEAIVENFRSEAPRSVVLTGTAGDGKTWLCREVWQQLHGSAQVWASDAKQRELPLPCGAKLVVLKDLSEIREDATRHLETMAESIYADGPREVFLVAANDGQLRQAWERVPRITPSVEAAARLMEDLLVLRRFKAERAGLTLYNLSRQDSAALMTRVIDALLAHEGWSRCEGCPGKRDEGPRCPVWANQEKLRDPLMRERLTDLLTLCDQSGFHLPVRQLLILASNMLLGHPDGKDDLLRCQEAEKAVKEGKTHLASIYRNTFGENLPESRRESTKVFEVLRRFGIGEETSNRIDNLLVYGHDDPELQPQFSRLFEDDQEYGSNEEFERSLDAYLEGREVEGATPFPMAAVAQRQRLFFTMPKEQVAALGLWELTVFRYAGEFLDGVLRPLMRDGADQADDAVLRPLVRGLNRVFTGRLTENQNALWLASSGSHSQARVCRIYEFKIEDDPMIGRGISLRRHEGRPALVVSFKEGVEEALPLHLVRFEFLSRVAEGALSSNFSRECYEDILSFKSRLLSRLKTLQGNAPRPFELSLLHLDESGKLQTQRVNLNLSQEGAR